MAGYLESQVKAECFGCEACVQVCPKGALAMAADAEGFRYPVLDGRACVACGRCRQVCPAEHPPKAAAPLEAWGGWATDGEIRAASTSGGAFSALVQAWADEESVVFGAEAVGLEVRHVGLPGGKALHRLRKSKYLQSQIGETYREVKAALAAGKRVLFSGTPCQVAGLKAFLGGEVPEALLLVEVVCEGVPCPHYIQSFAAWLGKKLGGQVESLDYRDKDGGRWDFEVMSATLQSPRRGRLRWKQDRWFNPFWSIWLQHLISRPSCYRCPFAKRERTADLTLGDLWGVHLYCPELYGKNGGASLIFANTAKGQQALQAAQTLLAGHALDIEAAIRYQGPLRKHIQENPDREACLRDLRTLPYEAVVKKWAKPPTLKLLLSKYLWGNRQKVWWWTLTKGSRK